MLVPTPCETSPPQRFSRKLATAKPTMCAQQPAQAAAAPSPALAVSSGVSMSGEENMITPNAALDVGRVNSSPIITAMSMPNDTGSQPIAMDTPLPNSAKMIPNGMPSAIAASVPQHTAASGTTIISIGVLPSTRSASSIAATAATNAPTGSPTVSGALADAPYIAIPDIAKMLVMFAPSMPATAAEKPVSFLALRLCAMPAPIPAPIMSLAMLPMFQSILPNGFSPMSDPICPTIVPMMSVQNSPSAIPENASIKYLCA